MAVNETVSKSENIIDYCIKKLIAAGVSEEDAKIKCTAISSTTVPSSIPSELQTKISDEYEKCKSIEEKIISLKKSYESEVNEVAKQDMLSQIEELQKSLRECYGSAVATIAQETKVEEVIQKEVSRCAKIETDIANLKRMYENATEDHIHSHISV